MNRTLSKAVLTIVFSLASLSANAGYTFSLLDGLGGSQSIAYGINNAGQIVGQASSGDGSQSAVLWNKGMITSLGSLGGNYNAAIGINASGQIAGFVSSTNGSQGAIWDNGTLFTTSSSAMQWQGNVINNAGQVVFSNFATPQRGILWSEGTITELSPIAGADSSQAKAINNLGQAVGSSFTSGGVQTATLWTGGNASALASLTG
jgi:probable HAF family extracellular repeat protein